MAGTKPFSFDEDVTDFREADYTPPLINKKAADYTPPLISKWRPVKETRSPETTDSKSSFSSNEKCPFDTIGFLLLSIIKCLI
jgi:hypothetical protein